MGKAIIKPASQVRDETTESDNYRESMDKNVCRVVASIEHAKSRGVTHATFDVDREWESEVRRAFAAMGYTFRPIGVCGGVLQRGEYICW